MLRKMSIRAAAMLPVFLLTSASGWATIAAAPSGGPSANASLVQSAQWWRWRRDDDDDDRYWRSDRDWRYDGYYYQCRTWRHRCAERWGWDGWEFRRCVRRHGC
jgi:hypothetical protein